MNPVMDSKAAKLADQLNRYSTCMTLLRSAEEWVETKAAAALAQWTPLPGDTLHPMEQMVVEGELRAIAAWRLERLSHYKAALHVAFDYDQNPMEDNLYLLEQFVELIRK